MKKNVKESNLPEICKEINEKITNGVLTEVLSVLGFPDRLKYDRRTIEINDFVYREYCQYHYDGMNEYLEVKFLTGVVKNDDRYYREIEITFKNDSGVIQDVAFPSDNIGWFTDDKLHRNVWWVGIGDIMKKIRDENPSRFEFLQENKRNIPSLLSFPALEILYKSGYTLLADKILCHKGLESKDDAFNRNFKNGTSPKTIFQIPKRLYKEMKNIDDLNVWDNVRKLTKKTDMSTDALKIILSNEQLMKDIDSVYSILNAKWNGKRLFTVETLVNYLNRLDVYEAIDNYEGIIYLRDYLRMCDFIKMKPKIDGDSLKREHDIAARLCRQIRNEQLSEQMESRCAELQKYNYEEDVFFVRGIEDYDDLLDEATQQHNCVASYARSIAEGRSLIYVMREKKAPEKSLITIELTPKTHQIRQKLLAYNCPIRNKAQTEFIERWHKHIRECV